MTLRWDSSSSRRECSYDVCQHTNHKAIDANNSVQVTLIWNHKASFWLAQKLISAYPL